MPQDRRHRSRGNDRSPKDSFISDLQKNIADTEKALKLKTAKLVKDKKRLEKDYGLNVELDTHPSSSRSPINTGYMSPIRVGVPSYDISSPIRVDNHRSPRESSLQHFQYEYPQFPYERPGERVAFEYPPGFEALKHNPLPRYYSEVDVRVDEMPRWPRSPTPEISRPIQMLQQPPSFAPFWQNQEDVHVQPMPVFPMGDDDVQKEETSTKRSRPRRSSREDKARLQMQMIAQQAEMAEMEAKKQRQTRKEKELKEEEERRKAKREVQKYRDAYLEEQREKKRKEELEKRKQEREKRHEQQKKEEEEKRKAEKRKYEETCNKFEADEKFLNYLKPALGKIECEAGRNDSKKKHAEYKGTCSVVNIPKELLCASYESSNKGSAYKGAISSYVNQLVGLGVINEKTRKLMAQIENYPKFLADLVEPLCNDIAIFGTQISVTNNRDMNTSFVKFAKEKCAEFWDSPENNNKMTEFVRKSLLGKPTSSKHRRERSRSRTRSRSRRRSASPQPLNDKQALEKLFATHRSEEPVQPAVPVNNNFMVQQQQQQHPTPLMSIPMFTPQMMNPYQQPMMGAFPPQPLMMPTPLTHRQSRREDDAELMDEIFT